MPRFCRVLG